MALYGKIKAKLGGKPFCTMVVLAAGSFYSGGIMADYEHVFEPVFDLRVDALADRSQWALDDGGRRCAGACALAAGDAKLCRGR